jgi:Ca2+-transporting ATPase
METHGTGEENQETAFHAMEAEAVLEELDSSPDGLPVKEAQKRLVRYGTNRIRSKQQKSLFRIFLEQINNPVIYLLSAATVIAFVFGDIPEGIAIIVVIVLNTLIGFFMEVQARTSMEALQKMDKITVTGLRGGELEEINAEELVPGDIILPEAGDIIPADARIIDAAELRVDESPLTGESVPVNKSTEPVSESASLGDHTCMLYKGTSVTGGNGKAVVTATGMETEIGTISKMVSEAEKESIPLNRKLNKLTRSLIWFIGFLAGAFFIAGWLSGKDWYRMLQTAIAWTIAAIPEGLPIVASIALARGMLRLAKQNVIIKKLAAVETLGETTVIFTDKTGTLTENRLTVTEINVPEKEEPLDVHHETNRAKIAGIENYADLSSIKHIFTISRLCNNAVISGDDTEDGDPLELSLIRFTRALDHEGEASLAHLDRVNEDPFDSKSKFMATVHRFENGSFYVAGKGAASVVLGRSAKVVRSGGAEEFSEVEKEKWKELDDSISRNGLKSLAFCFKEVSERTAELDSEDFMHDMIFVGLVGFIDPPRREIEGSIEMCHTAGIRPVMVTGDHPGTAGNIARQVGLVKPEEEKQVMTGSELSAMEGELEKLGSRIASTPVFARVDPEQKLDIVEAYQKSGEICAMTGDGVNDAPALKKADIGIAMGKRGTQTASEVSDMVLQDDSFSSIVTAVEQGRIIFGNIRKFVMYQLSYHLAEILLIAVISFTLFELPLLPLQLLFLNLLSDVFPALALGIGKGTGNVMKRPPKDPSEPILNRRSWFTTAYYGIVMAAYVIGAYLVSFFILELPPEQCNDVAFFSLAFTQILHVFNMRDPEEPLINNQITRNRYIWMALALCFAVLSAAYFIPGVRDVLSFQGPGKIGWLIIAAVPVLNLLTIQLIKAAEYAQPIGER